MSKPRKPDKYDRAAAKLVHDPYLRRLVAAWGRRVARAAYKRGWWDGKTGEGMKP